MAYEVLRVASVGRTVEGMTRHERRSYDAAVQALRGEGCRAGGKRLMARAAATSIRSASGRYTALGG